MLERFWDKTFLFSICSATTWMSSCAYHQSCRSRKWGRLKGEDNCSILNCRWQHISVIAILSTLQVLFVHNIFTFYFLDMITTISNFSFLSSSVRRVILQMLNTKLLTDSNPMGWTFSEQIIIFPILLHIPTKQTHSGAW